MCEKSLFSPFLQFARGVTQGALKNLTRLPATRCLHFRFGEAIRTPEAGSLPETFLGRKFQGPVWLPGGAEYS
jgi:hypothetical protein